MGQMIGAFIYVAIGMLVFMIFHDFSWSDQWLYIYMALWPFILFFNFLFWVLIGGAIILVILFILDRSGVINL